MRVLGIETSCDETGIAIVEDGRRVITNEVASQIDVHAEFGGVVPEIASRQHTTIISQLTERALDSAGGEIDGIAATAGPGLMGSLMVGLNFAKALAYARGIPLVPVQHLEGHIFSVFLADDAPEFPFLALLVSGGHTSLVWCEQPHHYAILGTTRDDAVGESFDKVARLLGLPYPGGPSIQKAAEGGDPEAYNLPRAMADATHLDFSYSGLKTAVLYATRDGEVDVANMAASFQAAAVDVLMIKTKRAIQETNAPSLVVAGGVAANKLLRERMQSEMDVPVFIPPFAYCIDNGAMIAAAGHSMLQHGLVGDIRSTPFSSLPLPS